MDNQKITEQFAKMADITLEDAASYSDLISISILDVQRLLKEDTDILLNQNVLNHLCAAICFYKYALTKSIDEPINVQKLGISVNKNNDSKIKNALCLKNEAMISARHLLKDETFFFEGVV